jgi:hypothetical protein
MRLLKLASRPDGAILATLRMASGDRVDVAFTTARRDDITVASPDRDIFSEESLSAEGVRSIAAAVIAFDRVAQHSETA